MATLHNARRGQAQGRADRRHGRAAQGRRRHPRGRRPGRRPARRHRARVRDADALPGVRHRAAPGQGGRRRHPLPQRPVLPGAAAGAAVPPGRPRRVRHRGARLRGGRWRCSSAGVLDGRGRPVRPRPRTTCCAPRSSASKDGDADRPTRAKLLANLEAAKDRPLWRVSSRCRSGTSGRPRPRRWPGSSASSSAIADASEEELAAVDGRRARRSPPPCVEWFAVDWHREIVRKWADGRRADGGGGRRRGPAAAGGAHRRRHRLAGRLQPRPGDRGGAGRAAARSPARCRRRPTSWWSATSPGSQVRQGGVSSGCRCSTRRASRCCWPRARTPPGRRPACRRRLAAEIATVRPASGPAL